MNVSPPVRGGTFHWGNAFDHSGFDAHAWPGQRTSLDISVVDGPLDVYPMAKGVVVQVENPGQSPDNLNHWITVWHPELELWTGYYHLKPGSLLKPGSNDPILPGEPVSADTPIARDRQLRHEGPAPAHGRAHIRYDRTLSAYSAAIRRPDRRPGQRRHADAGDRQLQELGRRYEQIYSRKQLTGLNANVPQRKNQMSSLTTDQAIVILNAVGLPTLTAEHPVTKRVIGAIPPDKADYRPDTITKSAIDLAWHIVTAEIRFFDAVAAGTFDLTPAPRPDRIRTADDVNGWYAERWATSVERLRQLTGDQLTRRIDFRGILNFPAVVYIQVGLNHSIHHRGQLSMYLRPMGAAVPSIYGESYDAREARERAAAIQQK